MSATTAPPPYFFLVLVLILQYIPSSLSNFLADPIIPGGGPSNSNTNSPYFVPSVPLQTQQSNNTCKLDLSAELFGGVKDACAHRTLDRSRCCPVLAAWLFAAHSRYALQLPAPSSPDETSPDDILPIVPDDSQKCVDSLQTSLLTRNIHIVQPNASCDAVLCFCGIRLHQISSLSCSAAFNVSNHRNATPTAAVRNLERSCRNSSYSGCTKCLGALQKLKTGNHSGTTERADRIFNKDCQLMGLTWLLARNKTTYIPTVSAVLRAMMYSTHPHEARCSPDQENMPLAVDSLQLRSSDASRPSISSMPFRVLMVLILPFLLLGYYSI